MNKPTRIFVHTTAASYQKIPRQFMAVNRWHKERFGTSCRSSLAYYGGYHTLIEPNGWEGRYREDWENACAVVGWNESALHVALTFDGDIEVPTLKQQKKLVERILKWSKKYNIKTTDIEFVGPHRLEAPHKTCYGSLLPDDYVVKLIHPVDKDTEDQEKKDKTEAQKQLLLDQLRMLVLQLTILVGEYTGLVNKRIKR